jgi:hypothetical protein
MSLVSDLLDATVEPASPFEPVPGESRTSANADALRLIAEAEMLGIPWREVLRQEIHAEGTLQRFLGSDLRDLPLWRALSIIPNSLFHSWRVRELIDRLCYEASAEGSRRARRELASLLECLSGPRARKITAQMTLAKHYWFAYQRILELQAVALAADRCRSTGERRRREVCESTGCSGRDADWAVDRWTSASRSHALDDAVRRAREEGFEIPFATTELQAFSRLRRFVLRHRVRVSRAPGRRREGISVKTAGRACTGASESESKASEPLRSRRRSP